MNNTPRILNDWTPETTALLNSLTAAGFTLLRGHNGEEAFKFDDNLPAFIENLIACDGGRFWRRLIMIAQSFFDSLKPFGKFTRTQAWTLVWEKREQMEKAKAAVPELAESFINLLREDLDKPKAASEV